MSFAAPVHSDPKTESKSHHPKAADAHQSTSFLQQDDVLTQEPLIASDQDFLAPTPLFAPEAFHQAPENKTEVEAAPVEVKAQNGLDLAMGSGSGGNPSGIERMDVAPVEVENQVEVEQVEAPTASESTQEPQAQEAAVPEEFYPRSPEEDPGFQAVQTNTEAVTEHQQRHNEPQAEVAAAQASAPIGGNEVMGGAQANQVEAMEAQEPNEFDAAGFKAKLMERIAAMQMPETLEEADEFEKHSNINDINQAANQDVGAAQANAAGPIDAATQAEPNTGAVPEREVVELPEADLGTTPESIGANSAMPARRPESQVSQPLQENMGKVDDVMAQNEVTDDMLANSNEPSFTGALDQTNEARAHTESAPQGLRAQEAGTLDNAQQNAENQSNTQMQNMQTDREGVFGMLANQQNQTATQDTSERTRIASEIDTIYNKAKTDVERILEELETKVSDKFTAASDRAKIAFERHVDKRMKEYKKERYDVIGGSLLWASDKLFGMPKEVEKFFVEGRQVFIDHMDKELTVISEFVAKQLNAAKDRIAQGRQEVADYVAELPENLQSIGQEAADAIQDQFDSLQESVNAKQDELIESLAQQYSAALEEVDARIEEMKAENAGLIDAVMGAIMGVIQTIIDIKNMFMNLLAKAIQAIGTIISDPIGFLTNFFGGIKLGFEQFGTNILKHLQAGFLTWLTGAMQGVNLQMPDDIFSLKGIFSLTSQILGFTWDRIRAIGVKVIGEPIIKVLEVGFEVVMILREQGLAGLWEYIKEQFNDLKATVMDAIMDMIQSQVIQAGIKWILGLLSPVGAFIKACMAIIDVVVFFVQKAKQIMELIDAFLDSILAVASGSVGAVANLIENALARAVPVLIGFLASLLGLSGLAAKVTKIFQKIQQRVEKAVTKLWMKLKEMGKKVLAKLGIGGKDEHDPEKQQKIDAGFMYLKQQEQQVDIDGNNKLTVEQANQAAQKTKAQHPVFSSLRAEPKGDKVSYKYTASPEKDRETGTGLENTEKVDGHLMNNSSADKKTDLTITETREGNQRKGYKAKLDNSTNEFDGIIVGDTENAYVKKRKEKGDFNEKYNELVPLSVEDRRKKLDAGVEDHDKFKPVQKGPPTINGNKTTIVYGYEGGSETFTVTYDNKTNETESVSAKNLSFHGFGRGKTQGETKEGMNRAHIVANEVRGSGYVEGHNLMLTSDTFNQVTMRGQEKAIADYLNKRGETIDVTTFDMDVKVERYEKDESVGGTQLREKLNERKSKLEGDVNKMTDEDKATSHRFKEYSTIIALLGMSDADIEKTVNTKAKEKRERRVKEVTYTIKKITFVNGNKVSPDEIFFTGPDYYLGTK